MNDIKNCKIENILNEQGNPSGGSVVGIGLTIQWQNGPLGRDSDRKEPNGAFVETVISSAKQRLEFFEKSDFHCRENELAIKKLGEALDILDNRTKERESRQVEGTHKI